MHKTGRGFTLIELMVVLVVTAILAAVAYPSYRTTVLKTNRTDARTMLTTVAARQEQFFLNNKSYTTDRSIVWNADTNDADGDGSTVDFVSEHGYYELAEIVAGPTGSIATSYALQAIANGQTHQDDDTECGNFTLNSRGTRGETGTLAVSDCW